MTPTARARVELAVGGLLVLAVVAAALFFKGRPGPTILDRWAFAAIRPVHHSGLLVALTRLGSPFVIVAAAVTGSVATVRRNLPRSAALLVGPVLAIVAGDWVLKPVVGRTFAGVVSFPSGTVTVVAAIATVALLATPDPWRALAAALGGTVTVLECVAVVALRWHLPTDAVAGVALGAGVVLVTDCAARAIAALVSRPDSGPVPGGRPDAERATTH